MPGEQINYSLCVLYVCKSTLMTFTKYAVLITRS